MLALSLPKELTFRQSIQLTVLPKTHIHTCSVCLFNTRHYRCLWLRLDVSECHRHLAEADPVSNTTMVWFGCIHCSGSYAQFCTCRFVD